MDTVIISDQEWAVQNLATKVFRNGDKIMEAQTNDEWERASKNKIPAWCYYKKNVMNEEVYGILYNWYAVNDPRGLAPDGWAVPSKDDWEKLATFLGNHQTYKLRSDEMWMADEEMASFYSAIRRKINNDNDANQDELKHGSSEEGETTHTDDENHKIIDPIFADGEDDQSNDESGDTLSDDEINKIIDSLFSDDDDEFKPKEISKNTSDTSSAIIESKDDDIEYESNYDGDLTSEEDLDIEEEDDYVIDDAILNSTNFNAQPGGARGRFGNAFFALGDSAYWWTSTEDEPDEAYFILLYYHNDDLQIGGSTDKKAGHSVRCIKVK